MQIFRKLFLGLALFFAATFAFAAPIDINKADAETLAAGLTDIGPEKAKNIIEYRKKNGPFKSIDELMNVKGIGSATLEKNEGRIVVGEEETAE